MTSSPTTQSVSAERALPAVRSSSAALTPGLIAGFVVISLVLIATLVIGLANLQDVFDSAEAVAHTQAVKGALDDILMSAVDAETGERGFVITGNAAYLEPYERARTTLSAQIAAARAITSDNRDYQVDFDALSTAAVEKLRQLANAVEKRRNVGFAAAQAAVSDNIGKHVMDQMRVIVARMEAREDALLTTRTARAAQSYRSARMMKYLMTGIALLVVMALFVVTRRSGVERLRAAEMAERLRVTLASIGDAVIATDDAGRVIRMNPIAEGLTGWTEADAVGQPMAGVFVIINEETRKPAENPVDKVLREGVIIGLANHTVLIAKDGREIPVDDSAAPIKTAEGTVAGVVMVFRDVSERRRVEQARAQNEGLLRSALDSERMAKGDADRANRLKDEFLGTVSHELRTPLNAILGWAEVLRTSGIDETLRQRAVGAVYDNARRQAQIVDDLLDMTGMVSGKMRMERAAVDVTGVVRAALDVVQPAADAKRIRIVSEIEPGVGAVLGDAGRLQQILWNLLSNAVKFTPDGGAVRLGVRRLPETILELTVKDSGQGITADFLPLVFEPFRQAEGSTTRRHGGIGLGLTIVKHLVEAHGGTVTAESDGARLGSTFRVRLPIVAVYDEAPDAAPTAAAPMREAALKPDVLKGVTVLVVEDDADSRDLVAACLRARDAVVLTAPSASAALAIIERERVDVLLADIAMADEDGYSLIRKVRALEAPSKARIPAAALTSLTHDDDRQRAADAGFQMHLGKPIESRRLVEAVVTLARQTI